MKTKISLVSLYFVALTIFISCAAKVGDPVVLPSIMSVFSENTAMTNGNAVLNITGGSVTVTTNGNASEGFDGLRIQVGGLSYIRLDLSPSSQTNLTNYQDGYLNFCILTTSTRQFRVGIQSSNGQEAWITLSNSDYAADGNWHQVAIPLSVFGGIDLGQVTSFFMISNSGTVTSGDIVYLDDICWSSSSYRSIIWKIKWSDEFTNASLDASSWTYEFGNNSGWGNSELETYTNDPANSYISNSNLVINSIFLGGSPLGVNYSSARIKTQGKHSWTYGRIAARMRLDINAQGSWPAFWMLGENIIGVGWPACGEIDIMECGANGSFSSVGGTIHWQNNSGQHAMSGGGIALSSGTFADAYHIFEVDWNTYSITWYMDGVQYFTTTVYEGDKGEFHFPQFIIINLAVGGVNCGFTGYKPVGYTNLPDSIYIDWVRVYQLQ